MHDQLEVIELCAGAGGQALGLHRAGFAHRIAIEVDHDAATTLTHNLRRLDRPGPPRNRTVVITGDVTSADTWQPERHHGVDLLAGGVPCPPFSVAGRRLGATDERDLYAWTVALMGRMRPRALLLENVAGLAKPRFGGYRQAVADHLITLGYAAEWRMLHASDFGVPQTRPRFVLVAINSDDARYFQWPTPQPTSATVGSALAAQMAACDWPGAADWARRADALAPTIIGGSKKHGGPDLGPTGSRKRWMALGVDGRGVADHAPGPTFPPDGRPRLTPGMLATLQGFETGEDGWDFLGSKTSRCRQIGNAFPPQVAQAVGTSIADALRHRTTGVQRGFTEVVHCPVFRALSDEFGRYVPVTRLPHANHKELDTAIEFLRRDFKLTTGTVGDVRAYRLEGWLPSTQASDLPVGSHRYVDAHQAA